MKQFLRDQIGARLVLTVLGIAFILTALWSPARALLGLESVKIVKVRRKTSEGA